MNKTCQPIRDLPGIRAIIALMVLLGFLTAFSGPSEAASSPWVIHDEARVRLIAADTAGQTGDLKLGIHFKINWRFVGDAGVPTSVDWTGSEIYCAQKLYGPCRFASRSLDWRPLAIPARRSCRSRQRLNPSAKPSGCIPLSNIWSARTSVFHTRML